MTISADQFRPATVLVVLARLALAFTIITLPWRLGILLVAQSYPPVYSDFTNLMLSVHEVFLLAMILLWGSSLVMRPRHLDTGPFFLWWPLVGVTIVAGISVITSANPLLAGYHATQLVLLILFYLFVVNEVKGLGLIATAVSLQILLQVIIGIGQVWQQHDLGLHWLGERALDADGGASTVWAQGALRSLRAYGLADHPNILAAGLVFSLLLLLTWTLTSENRWRFLAVIVFSLGQVTLFLTFSRNAWIAYAVGLGGTAVLLAQTKTEIKIHRSTWLPLLGLSALMLLPVVWRHLPYLQMGNEVDAIVARVQERLNVQQESVTLNLVTNDIFARHALTGVGLGNLPLAQRVAYPNFRYDYQPARVTLITAAAEIGLLGALFYFVALVAPWLVLFLNGRRLSFSPWLIGLSGALLAITLFNFYDAYTWFYPAGRLWQWLVWGLWAAAYRVNSQQSTVNG